MRVRTAVFAMIASATPALADCALDKIEAALAAPLDGLKRLDRDVSESQSTEGGAWIIYREKDGRVNTITRIDGGESGRQETRLSVVNRKTYGIASTRIDYMRHAFVEDAGPNAIVGRKTAYYFFCDGKLYLPPGEYAMMDTEAYKAAAGDALNLTVKDKDIADFTKGLAR